VHVPHLARLLGIFLLLAVNGPLRANYLYVSTEGSDAWSGTLSSPLPDQSDGPKATLSAAVNLAMESPGNWKGIFLRDGVYPIESPLILDDRISGPRTERFTIQSFPGEQATIGGSILLEEWQPVAGSPWEDKVPENEIDKLLFHSLLGQNLPENISPAPDLYHWHGNTPEKPLIRLFSHQEKFPLASWPTNGQWGSLIAVDPDNRVMNLEGFEMNPDLSIEGAWAHAFWKYDWSDGWLAVDREEGGNIVLKPPPHAYGMADGQRARLANILQGLERTGSWWLSPEKDVIIWNPPTTNRPATFLSSAPGLLVMDSVRFFTLKDVKLQGFTHTAVEITGGLEVTLEDLDISQGGIMAINMNGGIAHKILGCRIHDLSGRAIYVRGGNREILIPSRHLISGNTISHFGQQMMSYNPGVIIEGVEVTLSHNDISYAPHAAVLLRGNNHRVTNNVFHHLCLETGDMGAIYTGRNWTYQGNVIENNLFHNIQPGGVGGAKGVYLDDGTSGFQIRNNLFYKVDGAIVIGGGRNNLIEGNLIHTSRASINIDARFMGESPLTNNHLRWLYQFMDELMFDLPTWKTHYPTFQPDYEKLEYPEGNLVQGNLFYNSPDVRYYYGSEDFVHSRANLSGVDPQLIAPESGDFRPSPESPATEAGFHFSGDLDWGP